MKTDKFDIFISHSSNDNEIVKEIYDKLKSHGFSCWVDLKELSTEDGVFAGLIIEGIKNSKIFLLILSKNSNKSPHVINEISVAFDQRMPFVIYNVDLDKYEFSADIEYYISNKQFIKSFEMTLDQAHTILIRSINKILKKLESKKHKNQNIDAKYLNKNNKIVLKTFLVASLLIISSLISYYFTFMHYRTVEFKSGDIIQLGVYHQQPIKWVFGKNSKITKLSYFISKDLNIIKPFDVARSGKNGESNNKKKDNFNNESNSIIFDRKNQFSYNEFTEMYGSSNYKQSFIRYWLNSTYKTPAIIVTSDALFSPLPKSYYKIDFNKNLQEGGFLSEFSPNDIALLEESESIYPATEYTQHQSFNINYKNTKLFIPIPYYDKQDLMATVNQTMMLDRYLNIKFQDYYFHIVTEKVSIPSISEINSLFYDVLLTVINNNNASDKKQDHEDSTTTEISETIASNSWYTKTPCGVMPYSICVITPSTDNDFFIETRTVNEVIPIRPIIRIDTQTIKCLGEGTESNPYICKKK